MIYAYYEVMSKKKEPDNIVLDILKQLQTGQASIKKELRSEIGSVRAELGLMNQQLVTINGTLHHQRSETVRLEDRIARLEIRAGIDPETGEPLDTH